MLIHRFKHRKEKLKDKKEELRAVPQDGVRIRFAMVTDHFRLMAELSRDRFSASKPIVTDKKGNSFSFTIENETGKSHASQLKLSGTPATIYLVKLNGKKVDEVTLKGASATVVNLSIPGNGCTIELIKKG